MRSKESGRTVKLVIVRLQYISNFTDFDPFELEPDVEVVYSDNPTEIENADIVILPGSKNTVKDLLLLGEKGLDIAVKNALSREKQIIGICGGYQMLGKIIAERQKQMEEKVTGMGMTMDQLEKMGQRRGGRGQ